MKGCRIEGYGKGRRKNRRIWERKGCRIEGYGEGRGKNGKICEQVAE